MSEISAPYYFTYGSNMLLSQMKERCPNSMKEWVGMLGGYNLTFPRSSKNGGGVSSIELNEGGVVWGVIFSMTSNDWENLDKREGIRPGRDQDKNSYNKISVTVLTKQDVAKELVCVTYQAVPQTGLHPPSQKYLDSILGGAIENDLPKEYIHLLRGTIVQRMSTQI